MNIAVFISGRGSNFINLFQKANGFKIDCLVSNKPNAQGLLFAKEKSIDIFAPEIFDFKSCLDFINTRQIDLICLAGFMKIIPESFINTVKLPIINLHPSLLPKYKGLNTHQRALDAKESFHGSSIHLVDKGLDTGKLIAQIKFKILENDTTKTLESKILENEHILYPYIVNNIANKNIEIFDNSIKFDKTFVSKSKKLGHIICDK